MKTITCIAVDDEPLALEIVESYAEQIPFLNLLKTFTSPLEALMFMQENEVDVLFLDIQMPEISGLKLKTLIPKATEVIFITAYDEHAVKSYELEAFDYLLKPVKFERFLKSVSNALENRRNQQLPSKEVVDTLFVRSDKRITQIKIDEILFIEGLKDYVRIHLTDSRIITRESLTKLTKLLASKEFLRVHKSYIVPLKKIKSIYGNRIIIGDKEIPIGASYKSELINSLGDNILGMRDK